MREIQISNNKTLKLSNVLIRDLTQEEWDTPDVIVAQMHNFLISKGGRPVGPLIQHVIANKKENMESDVAVQFMMQCDRHFSHVDNPYRMESVVRVKNCLYAHYIGPSEKVRLAGQKLSVYAFENEIELKGDNYTIVLDEQQDCMIADVFMEKC